MKLILASNSPRRKQLLSLGGWEFTVAPAEIDEQPLPAEAPQRYVIRLAEGKARAAAKGAPQDALLLAADTTVVHQGEILGKPADARQAEAMLRRLRGHIHQVFTGMAVYRGSDGKLRSDLCATEVPMRQYSDAEMYAYIASGDPLDKAGAYAIQHPEFRPVERLQGCFANVMGLPVCHLTRLLAEFGVFPQQDVAFSCQQALSQECALYQLILPWRPAPTAPQSASHTDMLPP